MKHKDDLEGYMSSFSTNYDIIVCTETWLHKDKKHLAFLEGYQAVHKPATKNRADGVSIYIRDILSFEIVQESFEGCSGLSISIEYQQRKIKVTGIYRSSAFKDERVFLDWLKKYLGDTNIANHVILGDFNLDLLDPDKNVRDYSDILASKNYVSLINEPTRPNLITGKDSCIDHIHTKIKSQAISYKAQVIKTDLTDHYAVACHFRLTDKGHDKDEFHPAVLNVNIANSMLKNVNWDSVLNCKNVDEAMGKFYELIAPIIDGSSRQPKPNNKITRLKPWMTPGILKSIRKRNSIHKLLVKDRMNMILTERHRYYRNMVTKLIRISKECYYKKKLKEAENNPKKFWSVVNKLGGREAKKDVCFEAVSADTLNNYFSTVGQKAADKINQRDISGTSSHTPTPRVDHIHSHSFFLNPVDRYEVASLISDLKNTSSCGKDGITVRFLKGCSNFLSDPLSHIINLSFTCGYFPSQLKNAIVTPIYKNKGSKKEPCNYRPISVLSNISKIFEKAIKNRLVKFLDKYKIIPKNQFGFMKNKNSTQAVSLLIDKVVQSLENKEKSLVVLLDLAKAFDSVSHSKLLSKLERIGIRGVALKLFKSYLCGRKQAVKFGQMSSELPVDWGVPQGSILGPILFLIYTYDFTSLKLKNCYISSFADDTALFFTAASWEELVTLVNETLNNHIKPWFDVNLLSINTSKSVCIPFATSATEISDLKIVIHTCSAPPNRDCNCQPLEVEEHAKYLGIIIDRGLTWRAHSGQVENKLRQILFSLVSLKRFLSIDSLRIVYLSLFQSVLSYGIGIFGGACDNIITPLIRLQRRAIKTVLNVPKRYPSSELCGLLQVDSFQSLYEKDLKRLLPVFMPSFKLQENNNIHSYELRNKNPQAAVPPFLRLEVSRRNIRHNIINYYNDNTIA